MLNQYQVLKYLTEQRQEEWELWIRDQAFVRNAVESKRAMTTTLNKMRRLLGNKPHKKNEQGHHPCSL